MYVSWPVLEGADSFNKIVVITEGQMVRTN
jgi:hypothetical protein